MAKIKTIKTKTATYTYTWRPGNAYCDTEVHATQDTCNDCEDSSTCADCGGQVAGPDLLFCTDNGEVVHLGCDPQKAADGWHNNY